MEKITKKEAIQALSKHYQIPVKSIMGFIKAFQKLKEKWAKKKQIK